MSDLRPMAPTVKLPNPPSVPVVRGIGNMTDNVADPQGVASYEKNKASAPTQYPINAAPEGASKVATPPPAPPVVPVKEVPASSPATQAVNPAVKAQSSSEDILNKAKLAMDAVFTDSSGKEETPGQVQNVAEKPAIEKGSTEEKHELTVQDKIRQSVPMLFRAFGDAFAGKALSNRTRNYERDFEMKRLGSEQAQQSKMQAAEMAQQSKIQASQQVQEQTMQTRAQAFEKAMAQQNNLLASRLKTIDLISDMAMAELQGQIDRQLSGVTNENQKEQILLQGRNQMNAILLGAQTSYEKASAIATANLFNWQQSVKVK